MENDSAIVKAKKVVLFRYSERATLGLEDFENLCQSTNTLFPPWGVDLGPLCNTFAQGEIIHCLFPECVIAPLHFWELLMFSAHDSTAALPPELCTTLNFSSLSIALNYQVISKCWNYWQPLWKWATIYVMDIWRTFQDSILKVFKKALKVFLNSANLSASVKGWLRLYMCAISQACPMETINNYRKIRKISLS